MIRVLSIEFSFESSQGQARPIVKLTIVHCQLFLHHLIGHLLHLVAVLNLVNKDFSGFEARDEMLVNNNGCIARNISGDFFLSLFVHKTSKSTHINIMAIAHVGLYNGKESLNRSGYVTFVDSGLVCDLVDDV